MDDLAPPMLQDDKAEQNPERDGRNNKKVDGSNPVGMVAQEGEPAL